MVVISIKSSCESQQHGNRLNCSPFFCRISGKVVAEVLPCAGNVGIFEKMEKESEKDSIAYLHAHSLAGYFKAGKMGRA